MIGEAARLDIVDTVVSPDAKIGRQVLEQEAKALARMASEIDGSFTQAVGTLAGISGSVVVTGMGKSGHVARKIAATLASTGTPAIFVHPGEASHGDLGMITERDAILSLSNSGETPELSDMVAYSRRFGIPLIAITKKEASALGRAADIVLRLPSVGEACTMGLVPTTSTTLQMALGDALAVALLSRRGFTAEDFRVFHPGGKLGKILVRVSDLMHTGDALPLAAPDASMSAVILEMTKKRFGCVGVIDESGKMIGIVTDGDLRRHMDTDLLARQANAVMTPAPCTIEPQILAAEAVKIMNDKSITTLFALEDGAPVGILHLHDCLAAGII